MATDSAAAPNPGGARHPATCPAETRFPRIRARAQRVSWHPARYAPDPHRPGQPLTERTAASAPGVPVLLVGLVLAAAAVWLIVVAHDYSGGAQGLLAFLITLLAIVGSVMLSGLTPIQAGEARVVQLFGQYNGTVRLPGMRFVNPFTKRRKISTRIRNHETAVAKVNDADGNPIEIAAVVVWQVRDTAQALYAVDDFVKFVAIQTETAVRHIATSYPYEHQ